MPSLFEDPVSSKPEDIWEQILFECSYGSIRLDCQSTTDRNGRVLATYESPHKDGARQEDMGAEPRTTRCRIIFFQLAADDNPHERFAFFKDLVHQGETQTFTHPISGSYRAKVDDFTWSATAEERGVIYVDCTFNEDSDEPATFDIGPGSPSSAGSIDVAAASAAVQVELDSINDEGLIDDPYYEPLESDALDESVTLVETWELADPNDLSPSSVSTDLARVTNQLQDLTDEWELATNLDRYPLMVAVSNLIYTLRLAASSFVEDVPRFFEIRVTAPTPLMLIAQRTYGGEEAEDRFYELIRLNDIDNPAMIDAGTVLRAQSPDSSPRLKAFA